MSKSFDSFRIWIKSAAKIMWKQYTFKKVWVWSLSPLNWINISLCLPAYMTHHHTAAWTHGNQTLTRSHEVKWMSAIWTEWTFDCGQCSESPTNILIILTLTSDWVCSVFQLRSTWFCVHKKFPDVYLISQIFCVCIVSILKYTNSQWCNVTFQTAKWRNLRGRTPAPASSSSTHINVSKLLKCKPIL